MKFWRGICIGLVIGLCNTLYYSVNSGDGLYYPVGKESTMGSLYYQYMTELQIMMIAVCCWILIGILFSYAAMIFEEDERGLFQSTIIHYILCLILFMIIATFAGWTILEPGPMLDQVLTFTIIYGLTWLNYYYQNKKYVEEINTQLKNK